MYIIIEMDRKDRLIGRVQAIRKVGRSRGTMSKLKPEEQKTGRCDAVGRNGDRIVRQRHNAHNNARSRPW